ncbi:MAG: solute carrier family 23 protein, partial [Planctomycetota bacterium]
GDEPDAATRDVVAKIAEDADELAAKQQVIVDGLAKLRVSFKEAGLNEGAKSERRLARLAEAETAVAEASAALRAANEPSVEAALNVRAKAEAAEDAVLAFETSLKNHDVAAKLGLLTIAAIVVWQLLVTKVGPLKPLNVLPPPLVAVATATAAAWFFVLPVVYVEVPDSLLKEISYPTKTVLETVDWQAVLGGGLLIGAVASAESLLCAAAVDKLHKFPKANFDRELFAQGVGNSICGLLGALPMTGVIVRSSANVRSGATSRSSAVLHGVWLVLFVAALASALSLIPTTALAGVLVFVGYRLIDFAALKELHKLGKGELAVFVVTVAGIVGLDLLKGVVAGIILAAIRLLMKFGKLDMTVDTEEQKGDMPTVVHLRMRGAATFLKLPKLSETLDDIPPAADVRVDLTALSYIDHACVELFAEWRAQHEESGGTLAIDWDLLETRFRKAAMPDETPGAA